MVNSSTVTTDAESLFERNPVIDVFGKAGNLRMMITLIDAAGAPMSVASITDQANVSRQTFYDNKDLLLKYDLIEEADKVGNTQRYQVDMASEPIQALMSLYDTMIDVAPADE